MKDNTALFLILIIFILSIALISQTNVNNSSSEYNDEYDIIVKDHQWYENQRIMDSVWKSEFHGSK